MNIFGLIAHMSLLIHMGHDVEGIVDNIVQHKEKFPTMAEFIALVDDAVALLGSGIIGLPEELVKKMVDSLMGLKQGLAAVAPTS